MFRPPVQSKHAHPVRAFSFFLVAHELDGVLGILLVSLIRLFLTIITIAIIFVFVLRSLRKRRPLLFFCTFATSPISTAEEADYSLLFQIVISPTVQLNVDTFSLLVARLQSCYYRIEGPTMRETVFASNTYDIADYRMLDIWIVYWIPCFRDTTN